MPHNSFPSSRAAVGLTVGVVLVGIGLAVGLEAPAAAGPPDPTPGATNPVREQNLDATGLIRVHEQGVADVNVTNTPLDVQGSVDIDNFPASIEVSNLPDVQDVEVVGGAVASALIPLTRAERLHFRVAPDNIQVVQSFATVNATSVLIQAFLDAEVSVALGTPLAGTRLTVLEDRDGDIGWRQLTFVHPLPVNDVGVVCSNESDDCFVTIAVLGY